MMENKCVYCGAIIPEGRQCCPNCERGIVKPTENPYICFDCKHVGKCTRACLYTHDVNACKNFKRYDAPQWIRTTLRQLAEILNLEYYTLYGQIRNHGWGRVVGIFKAKGIDVYREKSRVHDKRFKTNHYIYYIRRK